MSKIVLKKLFDASSEHEKECCICMNTITNFDDAFIMYNCCGKIFHNECMTKNIFYKNVNCPLCNIPINIKDEENLLKKYATPLFLYKNFKEQLSELTGHSILELDNLYNSNTNFNSIIKIDYIPVVNTVSDTVVNTNESMLNENERAMLNDNDNETDNESNTEIDNYISNHHSRETEFIRSLCNCCECNYKKNLHFLHDAINHNDINNFLYYLENTDLQISSFSYQSKLELVCYIIDENSGSILKELLANDWISELQIEEVPEIYNSFIDNLENFNFDICEIIHNNFKISIPKIVLDVIEDVYTLESNNGKHEIFKKIINKSKKYIDQDNSIIYKN